VNPNDGEYLVTHLTHFVKIEETKEKYILWQKIIYLLSVIFLCKYMNTKFSIIQKYIL
jgi:hypothetical protein